MRSRPRHAGVFKWIVIVVLLLLIVGGVVLYFSLNAIIKSTVEKQATNSLKLQTTLDSANLSLFGGELALNGLKIAQPAGFDPGHLMALDGLNVKVSIGELTDDPIRIANITIDKPRLLIENKGGTLNIKKMIDDMPKTEPSAGEEKPMKLIISELTMKEAVVVLKPGLPGLPPELTVNIPTFTMKNIGQGEGADNGAAMKDVAAQVVTAMAAQAQTSDLVPPELRAILSGNLDGMVAQLKDEARKRVAEALPPEAKQAIGALESLQRGEIPTNLPGGVRLPDVPGVNVPGLTPGPTSRPGSSGIQLPKDVQDAAKNVPDIGGLLGGQKKDDKKK